MSVDPKSPAELIRSSQKASQTGKELLTAGLSVGAIGVAGALLGAVCPLCVVATPALLGFGAASSLHGKWLARRAQQQASSAADAAASALARP